MLRGATVTVLNKKKYVIILEAIITRLFILDTGQCGQRITHAYYLHVVDGVTLIIDVPVAPHNFKLSGAKTLWRGSL